LVSIDTVSGLAGFEVFFYRWWVLDVEHSAVGTDGLAGFLVFFSPAFTYYVSWFSAEVTESFLSPFLVLLFVSCPSWVSFVLTLVLLSRFLV